MRARDACMLQCACLVFSAVDVCIEGASREDEEKTKEKVAGAGAGGGDGKRGRGREFLSTRSAMLTRGNV